MEHIEINGIKYIKKDQSKLIVLSRYSFSNEKTRPAINLIEEYAKIIKKESNLSKNDRDWVVSMFKQNYQQIT